jgi:hypothetical protein
MAQQVEKAPAFYEDNKQQSQLFIVENTHSRLNRRQDLLLNVTCLYPFLFINNSIGIHVVTPKIDIDRSNRVI